MSTWIVQAVVVGLFALTCGALAAAWTRRRLGFAAIGLLVVAVATWIASLAAIATETGDANSFATCESCTAVHYVSAVAFLAPPLLIALAALAMLVARSSRWWARRAAGEGTA